MLRTFFSDYFMLSETGATPVLRGSSPGLPNCSGLIKENNATIEASAAQIGFARISPEIAGGRTPRVFGLIA
jgi:hypothetical protein